MTLDLSITIEDETTRSDVCVAMTTIICQKRSLRIVVKRHHIPPPLIDPFSCNYLELNKLGDCIMSNNYATTIFIIYDNNERLRWICNVRDNKNSRCGKLIMITLDRIDNITTSNDRSNTTFNNNRDTSYYTGGATLRMMNSRLVSYNSRAIFDVNGDIINVGIVDGKISIYTIYPPAIREENYTDNMKEAIERTKKIYSSQLL